ncbi:MAG: glycine--tRNA ligase subunit beta [Candidatus Riflebacteria bacterium]|nr:glycine--tRNA ligase subunit beta [Candidatus Riflebacteria bacterium]
MNLLIEIGFWGLNRGHLNREIREITDFVQDCLVKERLNSSRIKIWLSSLRLSLLMEGLPPQQADLVMEVKGPKAAIAFDINRNPAPAARGFAASQNCDPSQLFVKEVDGEKFLFAKKPEKGKPAQEALLKILPKIFSGIPWTSEPWAIGMKLPQPPLYLCSLLDESILEFSIDGIKSGREILLREGAAFRRVGLNSANDFLGLMNEREVLPNPVDRLKIFESKMQSMVDQSSSLKKDSKKFDSIGFYFERPSFFPINLIDAEGSGFISSMIFSFLEFPAIVNLETNKGKPIAKAICVAEGPGISGKEIEKRVLVSRKKVEGFKKRIDFFLSQPPEFYKERFINSPSAIVEGSLNDEKLHLLNIFEKIFEKLEWEKEKEKIPDIVEKYFFLKVLPISPELFNNEDSKKIIQENFEKFREIPKIVFDCAIFGETKLSIEDDTEFLFYFGFLIQKFQCQNNEKIREKILDILCDLLFKRKLPIDFLPISKNELEIEKESAIWVKSFLRKLEKEGKNFFKWEMIQSQKIKRPMGIIDFFQSRPDFGASELKYFAELKQRIAVRLPENAEVNSLPSISQEDEGGEFFGPSENKSPIWEENFLQKINCLLENKVKIESFLMSLPPVLRIEEKEELEKISILKQIKEMIEKTCLVV